MRLRIRSLTAAVAVLATAVAWLGCSAGAPDEASPGHGVVRALSAASGEVTIEHGEIPGLMDAMTMTFSVDDATLLAGVAVGDEVDFSVKRDGERYVVTEIRSK